MLHVVDGKYTGSPSNTEPEYIMFHVVDGKYTGSPSNTELEYTILHVLGGKYVNECTMVHAPSKCLIEMMILFQYSH